MARSGSVACRECCCSPKTVRSAGASPRSSCRSASYPVRRLPRCRCHSKQGRASRSSYIRTASPRRPMPRARCLANSACWPRLPGPTRGTTRGRQAGTCRASCRRPQPGRCLAPAARLRAKPLRGRSHQSAENRSSNGPTPGKHGAAPQSPHRAGLRSEAYCPGLATPVDAICTEVAVGGLTLHAAYVPRSGERVECSSPPHAAALPCLRCGCGRRYAVASEARRATTKSASRSSQYWTDAHR